MRHTGPIIWALRPVLFVSIEVFMTHTHMHIMDVVCPAMWSLLTTGLQQCLQHSEVVLKICSLAGRPCLGVCTHVSMEFPPYTQRQSLESKHTLDSDVCCVWRSP